jgi:hypothetical protein
MKGQNPMMGSGKTNHDRAKTNEGDGKTNHEKAQPNDGDGQTNHERPELNDEGPLSCLPRAAVVLTRRSDDGNSPLSAQRSKPGRPISRRAYGKMASKRALT